MRRAFLFAILVVILLPVAGRVHSDPLPWRAARTRHFIVYYIGHGEASARRAGVIAEKWHSILARKLGFFPHQVVPVYLYSDRRAFVEAAGIKPGDTVVGTAESRVEIIRIDASGKYESIARIIPHELVYVFISTQLGAYYPRLPLWMHEGLAKYLSDDFSEAEEDLLIDSSGGALIPLGELADAFPTDKRGRSLAYAEGYSAVEYMVKTYGRSSIGDILSELGKGEFFPKAMFYSIGVEPKQFESDWRQYVSNKYGSARLWRFASSLIWVLMALFVILAFRARAIQKRRKAAQFEAEEDASEEE